MPQLNTLLKRLHHLAVEDEKRNRSRLLSSLQSIRIVEENRNASSLASEQSRELTVRVLFGLKSNSQQDQTRTSNELFYSLLDRTKPDE